MIYGFAGQDDDGPYVVVTANDTLADYQALVPSFEAAGCDIRVAEGIDFLMDTKLSGLLHGIIITPPGPIQTPYSIGSHNIEIVHKNRAIEHQRVMMSKEENDVFHHETGDKRPLGEVYGLIENDPWDSRTEEQKAKQEEASLKGKDANKAGDLTGDSFAPAKKDKTARVTDVRVSLNPDGSVNAADVLAVKGLHDTDDEPGEGEKVEAGGMTATAVLLTSDNHFTASGFSALLHNLGIDETSIEFGPGWLITPRVGEANQLAYSLNKRGHDVRATMIGSPFALDMAHTLAVGRPPFAMFFRVDVKNIEIEDLISALEDEGVNLTTLLGRGENESGCWIGVSVERLARNYAGGIRKHYPLAETEVYAVSLEGERMAPEGVEVLDPNAVAEYGPRPWSDLAAWEALSDEDRAAEMKKVKAAEFIFTGSYHMGRGSTVLFTPKDYFEEHNEPWEGDIAPFVEPFFPQAFGMVTNDNGTFSARSVQYDSMVFKLARQGFHESTRYRLWLNLNF